SRRLVTDPSETMLATRFTTMQLVLGLLFLPIALSFHWGETETIIAAPKQHPDQGSYSAFLPSLLGTPEFRKRGEYEDWGARLGRFAQKDTADKGLVALD
ncbi:hypothetical protein PENTCL1PPCAC_27959, partial [Pristionchus entomophagus]